MRWHVVRLQESTNLPNLRACAGRGLSVIAEDSINGTTV
jgi:hypothetical protein